MVSSRVTLLLTNKVKEAKIFEKKKFAFLSVLLKQQSTQLPAMTAVVSHEEF
jgi:hypothetical protein